MSQVITKNQILPEHSPLGKSSLYVDQYDKSLLFPIPRSQKRAEIGIDNDKLPFSGSDVWHGYEISFLNLLGKPIVAVGEFRIPCDSANIIESKSFKLYLSSFNNTKLEGLAAAEKIMQTDLSEAVISEVFVKLTSVDAIGDDCNSEIKKFAGENIDDLDLVFDTYHVQPEFLMLEKSANDCAVEAVEEVLVSNLLKSNCLVTGQPDWGTVRISYKGAKIDRAGLLKYLVSFRNHNEFHEQCVERIFNDVLVRCEPEKLTVQANYTRRGGLDICPFRTNDVNAEFVVGRLQRQ